MAKTVEVKQEAVFTKEKIIASKKYSDYQDVINALWTDESEKTISEVDDMIEKFMKGKVN